MRLDEFAAGFEAGGLVFSRMHRVDQIQPGRFTWPRSELSDKAHTSVTYCETDPSVSPRVDWPAWIRPPEAGSLLGDPHHPIPGVWGLRVQAPPS